MESADLFEVFKRLTDKAVKFLDESHREMPLPEKHWGEEPLFQCAKGEI